MDPSSLISVSTTVGKESPLEEFLLSNYNPMLPLPLLSLLPEESITSMTTNPVPPLLETPDLTPVSPFLEFTPLILLLPTVTNLFLTEEFYKPNNNKMIWELLTLKFKFLVLSTLNKKMITKTKINLIKKMMMITLL